MNKKTMHPLICSLAGILLLLAMATCSAQEGNFDPTFGDSGRKLVDVSVLEHGRPTFNGSSCGRTASC